MSSELAQSALKLVYLNRAKGRFWSIEELFKHIALSLPSTIGVRTEEAKWSGANLRSIVRNLVFAFQIKDADVVHVTGDIHYAVLGIWRTRRILTIHDVRFMESVGGIRWFLLWLLWIYLPIKFADHVTVISEFTKSQLLALVGVDPAKISVIPDCIGINFHPNAKPQLSDPPVILHVGTTPNKNLERLISACEDLNVTLHILGRLNEHQKKLLSQNRTRYVEFFDLSNGQVVELYQTCDVVSFVSMYEGFGLPILEAQATGRPVVTSNLSPMNEVSGDAALHVDPTRCAEIRAAIIRLLNDQQLRVDLIERGFENIRNYSARAVAKQYADLYERVVNSTL